MIPLKQLEEIGAVAALGQSLAPPTQVVIGYEPIPPRHLLRATHLEALALLKGADEISCLEQGVNCPGVEPCSAARQHLHV